MLDKYLFFVSKSPLLIDLNDIYQVVFSRVGAGTTGAAGRTFDLKVITKTGPEHTFTSINKSEHEVTEAYLRDKRVKVKNEMVPDADLLLAAVDDDDDDDDMASISSDDDSRTGRQKKATKGGNDDDSEEDGAYDNLLSVLTISNCHCIQTILKHPVRIPVPPVTVTQIQVLRQRPTQVVIALWLQKLRARIKQTLKEGRNVQRKRLLTKMATVKRNLKQRQNPNRKPRPMIPWTSTMTNPSKNQIQNLSLLLPVRRRKKMMIIAWISTKNQSQSQSQRRIQRQTSSPQRKSPRRLHEDRVEVDTGSFVYLILLSGLRLFFPFFLSM